MSIINKWSQNADDEYLFALTAGQQLFFAWQTTNSNSTYGTPSYDNVYGNGTVPLNTLTHVAVVRNGPSLSFYINGVLDASIAAAMDTNPFRNGINTLRIGGQHLALADVHGFTLSAHQERDFLASLFNCSVYLLVGAFFLVLVVQGGCRSRRIPRSALPCPVSGGGKGKGFV